ncbi:MAG: hypothetical protein N4A76_08585 [Firmicutes bacterium]|jgi:propionate CoA-transferase|nr:hypothetical protein [Bacillota bacterium]
MIKVMTAEQAVANCIKDKDTVAFGGFVGNMLPEEIIHSIRDSYLDKKQPSGMKLICPAGLGDGNKSGISQLAHEGLADTIITSHFGLIPEMMKLAADNKIAAYNLPLGQIDHLIRAIAGGKPGVLSNVGLQTYIDPRVEGGKVNQKAYDAGDIIEVAELGGEEYLWYKPMQIDVGIIRASYVDTRGNCTFHREALYSEALAIAQAAHCCGGKVIVQAEKIVEYGVLDTRLVRIPGIYVDAIVETGPDFHGQTYTTRYNPSYSGETRVPLSSLKKLPLDARKIIARRAAYELVPNCVVNLGIGVPECVSNVAVEEGLGSQLTLTAESGTIGGIPAGGLDFGAAINPDCLVDQPTQFDFYDGGGLDVAYLGLAQMDKDGNINVSRFGPKIAGCGGFIDITQNSSTVVYCGTFTAGGLKIATGDGKVTILQEGKIDKLIDEVEQITFSGKYAASIGQRILYVTERAVFQLTKEGVELIEIAPGIDLEKDVLGHMAFKPIIKDVKLMDECIFRDEAMGLKI